MTKHQTHQNRGTFHEITSQYPSKSCQFHERQKLGNFHRLEEPKKTCQLIAMWDPKLESGPEKVISGIIDKI